MEIALIMALTLLMVPVAVFATGVFRVVLAVAFLVFFPGYTLVAALFPRKDSLDSAERLALSLVLSIAVVPLMGLVLNFTPWGIRTYPIVGTVSGFILVCSVVALWRRRRLPKEERFEPRIRLSMPHLSGGTGFDRALTCVLVLAVLGAAGTLAYVIAAPKHVEKFSEFYLLGADGMIEDYPQEAIVGQPVEVTMGIVNREHDYASYVVEITIEGDFVSRTDTVRLGNDKSWESKVSIIPSQPGPDQRVEFVLYKDDSTEPYRTLHLMLNVREES